MLPTGRRRCQGVYTAVVRAPPTPRRRCHQRRRRRRITVSLRRVPITSSELLDDVTCAPVYFRSDKRWQSGCVRRWVHEAVPVRRPVIIAVSLPFRITSSSSLSVARLLVLSTSRPYNVMVQYNRRGIIPRGVRYWLTSQQVARAKTSPRLQLESNLTGRRPRYTAVSKYVSNRSFTY